MSYHKHIFMLKYGHESQYEKHVKGAEFLLKNDPKMSYDDLITQYYNMSENHPHTQGTRMMLRRIESLIDNHPDNGNDDS